MHHECNPLTHYVLPDPVAQDALSSAKYVHVRLTRDRQDI
jgi:hypothetical protein